MIEVRVPRLFPQLIAEDKLAIDKWHVKEDEIIQPGTRLFDLDCYKGIFEVPTPPSVTEPVRVTRIFAHEGDFVHLGDLLVTLESIYN